MKALAFLFLVLLVIGCAGAPAHPLKAAEVRVARLNAPGKVYGGGYSVTFEGVEKGHPGITLTNACFTWSAIRFQDGPHCFGLSDNPQAKSATTHINLHTRRPAVYTLTGYLRYLYGSETRETNRVSALVEIQ